jgi:anti-sigma factor RsiW
MTYLEQAPGAHLVYKLRKHEISVLIFREDSLRQKLGPGSSAIKSESFSVETWSRGGLRYFVIGDASAADVDKVANLFKSAGQQT